MERNRSDNTHELHRGSKTNLIFAILFVFLVFIDQAGKRAALHFLRDSDIELIPGVLELHYLENKGAAWGMMQNRTWILITVTAIDRDRLCFLPAFQRESVSFPAVLPCSVSSRSIGKSDRPYHESLCH